MSSSTDMSLSETSLGMSSTTKDDNMEEVIASSGDDIAGSAVVAKSHSPRTTSGGGRTVVDIFPGKNSVKLNQRAEANHLMV